MIWRSKIVSDPDLESSSGTKQLSLPGFPELGDNVALQIPRPDPNRFRRDSRKIKLSPVSVSIQVIAEPSTRSDALHS
jgi:hypothetical protein